jgi:hypothetical protein
MNFKLLIITIILLVSGCTSKKWVGYTCNEQLMTCSEVDYGPFDNVQQCVNELSKFDRFDCVQKCSEKRICEVVVRYKKVNNSFVEIK